MKILIVTHYFHPHIGGIEIVAYNQAKELVKKGHKVTIITSKLQDENNTGYKDGIKIIRVSASNFLEKKMGIPYPIFGLNLIRQTYNEIKKADIVHIHGHVYLTSLTATIIAKKLNKRIILTQHNTFISYNNILLNFTQKYADKLIGRYVIKSSDNIISVSKKTSEYINSIVNIKDKIRLSYNGVDINVFKPSKNKLIDKQMMKYKNQFICFTVRRLTFKNGIDTILKTAERLINEKNLMFLIGGTGPDFNKISEYINAKKLSNVKLLGRVPDEILPQYYRISDVFILPSKQGEGFPLVILEALSSGIPVIATRSGGHVELIKNNYNGYLVSVDNSRQIAKLIKQLFKNRKLLLKLGKNSSNLVRKHLSWKINTKDLIQIYKGALTYEA